MYLETICSKITFSNAPRCRVYKFLADYEYKCSKNRNLYINPNTNTGKTRSAKTQRSCNILQPKSQRPLIEIFLLIYNTKSHMPCLTQVSWYWYTIAVRYKSIRLCLVNLSEPMLSISTWYIAYPYWNSIQTVMSQTVLKPQLKIFAKSDSNWYFMSITFHRMPEKFKVSSISI